MQKRYWLWGQQSQLNIQITAWAFKPKYKFGQFNMDFTFKCFPISIKTIKETDKVCKIKYFNSKIGVIKKYQ